MKKLEIVTIVTSLLTFSLFITLLVITNTPTKNKMKEYIIEHQSEIVKNDNEFISLNLDSTYIQRYKIPTVENSNYFEDITITVLSDKISVVYWADREKLKTNILYNILWYFKLDNSFDIFLSDDDEISKIDKEIIKIFVQKLKTDKE